MIFQNQLFILKEFNCLVFFLFAFFCKFLIFFHVGDETLSKRVCSKKEPVSTENGGEHAKVELLPMSVYSEGITCSSNITNSFGR